MLVKQVNTFLVGTCPQSIIQIVYLLHGDGASRIVYVSLTISVVSMIYALAGDDAAFAKWSWSAERWNYVGLNIFRIMDIGGTLAMYTFLWFLGSGYLGTIAVIVRSIAAMMIYFGITYWIERNKLS